MNRIPMFQGKLNAQAGSSMSCLSSPAPEWQSPCRGIRDASICLKFFVLLRRKKIHTPKHVLLEREWRG